MHAFCWRTYPSGPTSLHIATWIDLSDVPTRRLAARRGAALGEFAREHGELGLRALGGREGARRLLDSQDPGLEVPALVSALEAGMRA